MVSNDIVIHPVTTKAERKTFVELAYRLNANDPHWVPPLKSEVYALLNPKKNPFFEHATVQLFLALQDDKPVGRISAHIDHLAAEQPVEQGMGPGTGNWGMMEADSQEAMTALISAAEKWLKEKGMHRVLAPLSLSVWDEPGLLTQGHDQDPTIMMGHHNSAYQGWIEACAYKSAKQLFTYNVRVDDGLPKIVNKMTEMGERNDRINIRRVDKSRFDEEAAIIMGILNDAWSQNWGFVPLTDHEIKHVGESLRPIVFEDLILIAELDGEPVAFMLTLPDLNEAIKPMKGSLFPFNWLRLLWWIKFPKAMYMRVPLMGVRQKIQGGRLAIQLALMMVEYSRRSAIASYGTTKAEFGWILEDNQGMVAIAKAIESKINRVYTIYEKTL